MKDKDKSVQKKALVHYSSSGSESSTEPESQSEDEKAEKEEQNGDKKRFHNAFVAKVSDNIKTQPNYETLFNNKLLRSHLTNIQKVHSHLFKLCHNLYFLLRDQGTDSRRRHQSAYRIFESINYFLTYLLRLLDAEPLMAIFSRSS